jgi:hypothetical protein
MLFLPGTFISGILSTTFFDYDDNGLRVSGRWWILLATTIPLTAVVFATWLYWRSLKLPEPRFQTHVDSTQNSLNRVKKALRWS